MEGCRIIHWQSLVARENLDLNPVETRTEAPAKVTIRGYLAAFAASIIHLAMLIRTFAALEKLSSPYICLSCRLKQAHLSFLRQLRHKSQQTAATTPAASNKPNVSIEASKAKKAKEGALVKGKEKPPSKLSTKLKTNTKKKKVKQKGKSAVQKQTEASKDVEAAVKKESVVQEQTEASKDVDVAVKKVSSQASRPRGRKRVS